MPRKRKIVQKNVIRDSKSQADRDEVKKYLYKAQTDESYHKKYAKELRQLYEKVCCLRLTPHNRTKFDAKIAF